MSEFVIEVVRLGEVKSLPNSDNLSITMVHGGYPCVIRTADFKSGDLAVYIPFDAMVPVDNPRFAFLADKAKNGYVRISAARFRGQFSMGLLIPSDAEWNEGENVAEKLGVIKYEPPEWMSGAERERDHGQAPVYDIEGYRRHPDLLIDGEEVWITEKCHGENYRALWYEDRLWIGSHRQWKKDTEKSKWWQVARKYRLDEKLKLYPNWCFFGEVVGGVGGFNYGMKSGELGLLFFDILNTKTREYADVSSCMAILQGLDLSMVPTLFKGAWNKELLSLAEGQSTLGEHVREGIVIKPMKERVDQKIGRAFLKLHGQGFLLKLGKAK